MLDTISERGSKLGFSSLLHKMVRKFIWQFYYRVNCQLEPSLEMIVKRSMRGLLRQFHAHSFANFWGFTHSHNRQNKNYIFPHKCYIVALLFLIENPNL